MFSRAKIEPVRSPPKKYFVVNSVRRGFLARAGLLPHDRYLSFLYLLERVFNISTAAEWEHMPFLTNPGQLQLILPS